MKALSKQALRDYVLDDDEQRRVLDEMGPRDRILLEFLFATGTRISEALSITLAAVKTDGVVTTIIIRGKRDRVRQLKVRKDLVSQIRHTYKGKTYLFETRSGKPLDRAYVWRRVSQAAARTGKHFSPHCARHTFATHKIAETGKIAAVSRYLGHSNPAITLAMYNHEVLTNEELGIGV